MPMNRGGIRVLRNTTSTGNKPDKVLWAGSGSTLGLSTKKTPNPATTSLRLAYLMPSVPPGAPALLGFRVYRNGVPQGTFANTELEPGFGTASGLQPGVTYSWRVAAFNSIGEGPLSDELLIPMAAEGTDGPPPPTGGVVVGTPSATSATVQWTAPDPAVVGIQYHIYVNGASVPNYVTSETQQLMSALPSGRDSSVMIKSVLNGVESSGSVILTVTTAGASNSILLARSDDFVDTVYSQTKVTYGTGVHNWSVAENRSAIQNWYKASGWRSYRQEIAAIPSTRSAQLDFMRQVYPNQGCKFQGNIGSVGWNGLHRINDYTEQEVYAAAMEQVTTALEWLHEVWLSDPTLGITDLAQIIQSIGGPNEVNPGAGTVNANWARNGRIYAETIWNLMRNGKLWNGAYTRTTVVSGTRSYYVYTITRAGTFQTPTGAKAKFANYPSYFAKVPIVAPSTRYEFSPAQVDELGGPVIPLAEAPAGTRLHGKRRLAQFVEMGNPHQYQGGMAPDEQRLQDGADLWTVELVPHPGFTPSRPWEGRAEFTEGGYNHMGFLPNGAPTPEGRGTGETYSPDGNIKTPPWVQAVYMPILYALCFKKGWKFHLFEMMDDDDTPTTTTRTYNIQAYFGHIWTPNNDPSTWVPLASFNAIRRMNNLLKDRANPKVPTTFNATRRPMTVITRNGVEIIELTKANGETYYLVWRDNLSIFKDVRQQTETRIVYTNAAGAEVRGLPPTVNVTFRLDHASGTRTVDIYRPNKSRWIHEDVSNPTVAQSQDTRSTGHDDVSTWAEANPAPDVAVGSVGPGASFTFPVGHDLLIVRVKT